MPLLKKKPVPILPTPDIDALPPDTQVFFLKATGEIFLEYEGYANRLSYLLNRIFQCEFSGKSNLDYFSALESEKAESRIVRERFPDELKGRVLHTVQFQVMGRLDALVELIFERYKDRYFSGEKVFVDLAGDKYFARIAKVFPPQAVRTLARAELDAKPAVGTSPQSSATSPPAPPGGVATVDEYAPFAHKLGMNLDVSPAVAKRDDDPDEYLYTVQLMDEEHKFEGSFMEVKTKTLSRDRLAFSKSILKRYMRECVQRDAAIASPWIVKPSIALQFNIPQRQSAEGEARNKEIREGKLTKRRKHKDDDVPAAGSAAKKPRKSAKGAADDASSRGDGTPAPDKPVVESKKPIKYPIEDLDLDPMSIHDGRILRRVNAELPALPPKPIPSRDLLVPNHLFDTFIGTWNMLNIFSLPLNLSNFTLDDLAGALYHRSLTPRCTLLAEIHASLTNLIGSDASRVLGSTSANDVPLDATLKRAPKSRRDPGQEDVEMDEEPELAEGEYQALVRKGISHSRRWDRTAKLKVAAGREGWERHMVGALCQRGGPKHLDRLPWILRHLFAGADLSAPMARSAAAASALPKAPPVVVEEEVLPDSPIDDEERDELAEDDGDDDYAPPPRPKPKAAPEPEPEEEELEPELEEDDGVVDASNPELAYLSLDIGDKLVILEYLCTLVLGSKVVRNYIDDSETHLTEYRKQRADVNKERKHLAERKAILDGKSVKEHSKGEPHSDAADIKPVTPDVAMDEDLRPDVNPVVGNGHSNGHSHGNGNAHATTSDAPDPDEEEDQLADDDGMDDDVKSEAASATGSEMAAIPTARRLAIEEKKLEKQAIEAARAAELTKARQEAKSKSAGRSEASRARVDLEQALERNTKKDDVVEREFRRYQGVTRCRVLGRDRFHNRYWWFDGIGGMSLVGQSANTTLYGTGRLFIQGPTQEDWDWVCGKASDEAKMTERRAHEDVEPEATLGINEWAFYEEEEEIEALISWLNSKGTRELNLKNALAKWRGYILAGSRRRQAETLAPFRSIDARRSTRSKHEPNCVQGYLHYVNKLAKV